ncbi:MAG: hypothetical protein H6832_03205 [Planctomycetes bacterium]|nr:hypothetical protein [Planctomycetota bacterium]
MKRQFSLVTALVVPVLASLTVPGCGVTPTGDDAQTARSDASILIEDRGPEGDEAEAEALPKGVTRHYTKRLDANGTVPHDAIGRMVAQADAMVAARPLAAVDALTNWKALGPGNVGGRVRAILIHPTTPTTMWLGSVGGGVWKTTNGGSSWFALDGIAPYMAITSLVMDPKNSNRIFAGTGEGVFFDTLQGSSNLAAPMGAGVFVTTDGGTNWSRLASTVGTDWESVGRLAIDPNNSNVLLAGTNSGIQRSTDGGATWTKVASDTTLDIDWHPTDSMQVVAGTRDGYALYSTNGGVTWSQAGGVPKSLRIEVAYARSSPTTVYATASDASETISIFRSSDGGKTYTYRSPNQINTYSRYNNTLWVDPTDPNHFVLGAINLYKSMNGGATVTTAGTSTQNVGAPLYYDIHALVEHPQYDGVTNQTLFEGDDGGIHRTTNARSTPPSWQELNNTLSINQFYGAAISPDGSRIVGGLQDQGSLVYTGNSEGWAKVLSGDGSLCAWDPTNPSVCYAQIYWIRVYRSTNSGGRFSSIGTSSNIPDAGSNFAPSIVLDPNNSDRMYFAGAALWRSDNVRTASRPTWSQVKPRLNCPMEHYDSAHFAADPPCNISTMVAAKGNSDIVWVGHNNGQLYKSTNATSASPTWTRMDRAPMPARWVGRIAIDEKDPNRVYVAFMGYHGDNVWRTEDGGASWMLITGSGSSALPSAPVTSLALHRDIPGVIFAGTDAGLYWSLDDGRSWDASLQSTRVSGVEELVWQDNDTLMIVTHGRGIYMADTVAVAGARPVGSSCGIAAPPRLVASAPSLGSSQVYAATGAAPSAPVQLFLSPGAPTPIPLGNNCTLQPDLTTMIIIPAGATTASGAWNANVPIPSTSSLAGVRLTSQLFVLAQSGPLLGIAELSNGVEMRIGQ